MCVHMVQWLVQSISSRNIAGLIHAEYGYTRLSSPSLSLRGYQQPNVYRYLSMSRSVQGSMCNIYQNGDAG